MRADRSASEYSSSAAQQRYVRLILNEPLDLDTSGCADTISVRKSALCVMSRSECESNGQWALGKLHWASSIEPIDGSDVVNHNFDGLQP